MTHDRSTENDPYGFERRDVDVANATPDYRDVDITGEPLYVDGLFGYVANGGWAFSPGDSIRPIGEAIFCDHAVDLPFR